MKSHFFISLLDTKIALLFKFAFNLSLLCPSSVLAGGWQLQESNNNANLRGVWFADSLNGWVCGASGTILNTSTGGEIWVLQESGVSVDLEDVFFWDMANGWIVGDCGTILYTADMGEHWTIQNTPVSAYLHTVQFITEDMGVALGNQVTLSTSDGGNTWVAGSGNFSSFFWLDEYRGAYGEEYWVFYTIDAGSNWWATGVPLIPYDMWGYRDTIYFPTCPRDFYWVIGEEGVTDWIIISECAPSYPDWFVGAAPDSLDLKAVTLENKESLRLWAVGESGWIIFSEDSGKTWITSPSGTTTDLYEVSFPTDGYGWAVGYSGTILHYQDSVVNVIYDESYYTNSPESFELSSPYPNPFNNFTVIHYRLSQPGKVCMKLYNITGQPVMTLVDTWQDSGDYQAEWQGKNYQGLEVASGVYIIRLEVNGFQEVKKVAFLK